MSESGPTVDTVIAGVVFLAVGGPIFVVGFSARTYEWLFRAPEDRTSSQRTRYRPGDPFGRLDHTPGARWSLVYLGGVICVYGVVFAVTGRFPHSYLWDWVEPLIGGS